ncbi:hypothetical protein [Chromobacterium paludis]|uniref:Uncharacterized protein n=1 Tax=Chromobacterium paludis TaxID=2605945 RepID=A0A5C1DFC8_9NEIS|nr:hypothetical protein [Chromobacterium paludis]QEL55470.1 hypothetical protein FYK34_07785 [Chromobacterium paludis]
MQSAVEFTTTMLDRIDRNSVLSAAERVDGLIQRLIGSEIHLQEPPFSVSRLQLGGLYNPFDIHISFALVDVSKTTDLLEWLSDQRVDGYVTSFHRGDDMALFKMDSAISVFFHNIDAAAALDFENAR